ncbi:hypothetical protein BB561_006578 [Smittium simulii]|uniref:Reverse transcriptase RNase H-like domain-containing protein n=1 Tax=Smittium simulii TaxID=133385 RepID=A0A2T9Y321_9FUNG|nr:hypothetical protein BB561_006578 [Smittium simulii]
MLAKKFLGQPIIKAEQSEDSVQLFYAALEAEILESEFLEPITSLTILYGFYESVSSEQTSKEKEKNLTDIKGIKDLEYQLAVRDDVKPVSSELRRYSLQEKLIIQHEIKKMLNNNAIQVSNSDWILPIQLVKKLDELLEQLDKDENLKPMSYYSKKKGTAKRNYPACYLWDVKFKVSTENSAVSRIYNSTDRHGQVVRWIGFLSEYDFDLFQRGGKQNQVADYLFYPVLLACKTDDLKQVRNMKDA